MKRSAVHHRLYGAARTLEILLEQAPEPEDAATLLNLILPVAERMKAWISDLYEDHPVVSRPLAHENDTILKALITLSHVSQNNRRAVGAGQARENRHRISEAIHRLVLLTDRT